jgi:hypothetical protein
VLALSVERLGECWCACEVYTGVCVCVCKIEVYTCVCVCV